MDDIRQQNSHDHEDRERVLLHLVVLRQPLHRHEEREDGAAIQRRDGQQVEEHKVQVDQREHGQEHQVEIEERLALHHPLRNGGEPVENPRDHARQHGEQQIGGRTGQTHDQVALARVLEVCGVVWHRLGIAEHGHVHSHEQKRHDNGAERVDMRKWVERQAPCALGGGVA